MKLLSRQRAAAAATRANVEVYDTSALPQAGFVGECDVVCANLRQEGDMTRRAQCGVPVKMLGGGQR